jgi:hypothetical protein
MGRGFMSIILVTNGMWAVTEKCSHINYLELKAIYVN